MINKHFVQRLLFIAQLTILNYYWCQANDNSTKPDNSSTTQLPPCETTASPGPPEEPWLEQHVIGVFKVWHIIFSAMFSGLAIMIVLCCLFRCRIPRTKQEIEADAVRKKITKVFRSHLNKIKIEELEAQPNNLVPVLQKVEKMEVSRLGKQVSFEAGRLTWKQKLRAMFAMERELTHSSSLDDTDVSAKYDSNEGLTAEEKETKKQKKAEKRAEEEKQMKEVVKTVDSAKIDSSSFNDHFTILMGFESEKDRKKREKLEKKQKLKELKQKETDEKVEKKEREKQERAEKKRREVEERLLKEESKIRVKRDKIMATDDKHYQQISIEVNGNIEELDLDPVKPEKTKQEKISVDELAVELPVEIEKVGEVEKELSPKEKKLKEKEDKKLKEIERKEKEKEEKRLKEEKKIKEREEKKEAEERAKKEREERKLKEKEERERKAKEKSEKGKDKKRDKSKDKQKSEETDMKVDKSDELDQKRCEETEPLIDKEVKISVEDVDAVHDKKNEEINEEKSKSSKEKSEKNKQKKDKSKDRDGKDRSKDKDREDKHKSREDKELVSKEDTESKSKEEKRHKSSEKKETKQKEEKIAKDKEVVKESKSKVSKDSKDGKTDKDKEQLGKHKDKADKPVKSDKKSKSEPMPEEDVKRDKSRDRSKEKSKHRSRDQTRDQPRDESKDKTEKCEISGDKHRDRDKDKDRDRKSRSKDRDRRRGKLVKQSRSEEVLEMDVPGHSVPDVSFKGLRRSKTTAEVLPPDSGSIDRMSMGTATTTSTSASGGHRMSREEKTKKLVDIQRSKSRESAKSDVRIEIEDEFGNELTEFSNNGLDREFRNS